jgi:hypothetical protein
MTLSERYPYEKERIKDVLNATRASKENKEKMLDTLLYILDEAVQQNVHYAIHGLG